MKTRGKVEDDPLGSFEEQVMLAVVRTGGEAYGMSVRRELEDVTGREVTIGSVYITLDRLEAKGFLTSARTAVGPDGSSRRVFAMTRPGARALAGTRTMREWLWDGVSLRPLLKASVPVQPDLFHYAIGRATPRRVSFEWLEPNWKMLTRSGSECPGLVDSCWR